MSSRSSGGSASASSSSNQATKSGCPPFKRSTSASNPARVVVRSTSQFSAITQPPLLRSARSRLTRVGGKLSCSAQRVCASSLSKAKALRSISSSSPRNRRLARPNAGRERLASVKVSQGGWWRSQWASPAKISGWVRCSNSSTTNRQAARCSGSSASQRSNCSTHSCSSHSAPSAKGDSGVWSPSSDWMAACQ